MASSTQTLRVDLDEVCKTEIRFIEIECFDKIILKVKKDIALHSLYVKTILDCDKTATNIPILEKYSPRFVRIAFDICEQIDGKGNKINNFIPKIKKYEEFEKYILDIQLSEELSNKILSLRIIDLKDLIQITNFLIIPQTLKFLIKTYSLLHCAIFYTNISTYNHDISTRLDETNFFKQINMLSYKYDNILLNNFFTMDYNIYYNIHNLLNYLNNRQLDIYSFKHVYTDLLKCAVRLNNANEHDTLIMDNVMHDNINNINRIMNILEKYTSSVRSIQSDDMVERYVYNTSLKPLIAQITTTSNLIPDTKINTTPQLIYPINLLGLLFKYLSPNVSIHMYDFIQTNIPEIEKYITYFNVYKISTNDYINIHKIPTNAHTVSLNEFGDIPTSTLDKFFTHEFKFYKAIIPQYTNVFNLTINIKDITRFKLKEYSDIRLIFPNIRKLHINLLGIEPHEHFNRNIIDILIQNLNLTKLQVLHIYVDKEIHIDKLNPIKINILKENINLQKINLIRTKIDIENDLSIIDQFPNLNYINVNNIKYTSLGQYINHIQETGKK